MCGILPAFSSLQYALPVYSPCNFLCHSNSILAANFSNFYHLIWFIAVATYFYQFALATATAVWKVNSNLYIENEGTTNYIECECLCFVLRTFHAKSRKIVTHQERKIGINLTNNWQLKIRFASVFSSLMRQSRWPMANRTN